MLADSISNPTLWDLKGENEISLSTLLNYIKYQCSIEYFFNHLEHYKDRLMIFGLVSQFL